MLTLFFTVLLDLLGFGMILPLLPFYAQEFGASEFEIGLLLAVYSLAQLVMAPVLGLLSDRFGRRPVLLVAVSVGLFAYLLFAAPSLAFTPAWMRTHGIAVLLVARLLAGGAAATFAVAPAYIADILPAAERSKGMGLLGMAFGLGFIGGPALGGLLGQWGLSAVALGPAALSLVNVLLILFLLPESRQVRGAGQAKTPWLPTAGLRRLAHDRALSGLFLLLFVFTLCFSLMEATLALFLQFRFGFGQVETTWAFVYIGVLLVIVQGGLIGPLSKRFGDRRLAQVGIGLAAAGLLLIPVTGSLASMAVAGALLAGGSGLYSPTSMSLISRITPETSQGEIQGLSRSFGSLSRVLGPLAGTLLFERLGPRWPFHTSGAVMVVALLAAWGLLAGLERRFVDRLPASES